MLAQLREDIACILERDPAARSRLEILTCYPGLHAIWVHRVAHWLWRHHAYWAGRFLSHLGRTLTGIEIHPGAQIGRRVFIDHGLGVVIGETAQVGDDCTIYQGVTLGGTRLYKGEKRHPTLEQGVVVGAGAQILGGFTVGAHARVGSNAVVIKPVPEGATAVGNPARIILHSHGTPQPHAEAPSPAPAGGTPQATSSATIRPCADPGTGGRPTPWAAEPLQALLRGRTEPEAAPETDQPEEFAPYGVARGDDDPLVRVLHELIDHTAQQDKRIHQLCEAMEELGQRIENGQRPLDVERLNRMVD